LITSPVAMPVRASASANRGRSRGRVLITLWHPRQTLGEGADRHVSAVETFRSLLLDQPAPSQLTLFGDPR
jgi:hypothetical protein